MTFQNHSNFWNENDKFELNSTKSIFFFITRFSSSVCWKQVHWGAHAFLICFKTKPILLEKKKNTPATITLDHTSCLNVRVSEMVIWSVVCVLTCGRYDRVCGFVAQSGKQAGLSRARQSNTHYIILRSGRGRTFTAQSSETLTQREIKEKKIKW